MATTIVATQTVTFPHGEGGVTQSFTSTFTQVYTATAGADFDFTSAATDDVVPFGSITSAKVVLITSSAGGCSVKINANANAIPVAGGTNAGFFLWCNAVATGGITAMTVSTTGAAQVKIQLFA